MMRSILLIAVVLGSFASVLAQANDSTVSGQVYELDEAGKRVPLVGANVYWLGTSKGAPSDANGQFSLDLISGKDQLVVSYIGYQSDTLAASSQQNLDIQLLPDVTLDEVEVEYRQKTVQIDYLNPLKSEHISEKELMKAACCNLSESFETNPSVDVSFTDAVTGTRQIQMLGLAGPYTQITKENMPDVRGLSAIYGMVYIPGTWIESIQLNKGAGSVVNGFESVAGQINVELRKPEDTDKLYANLYANEGGRFEANLNWSQMVGENWSTAVLLHTKANAIERDRNKDGFLDNPLSQHFIGLNRWKYIGVNGFMAQFGIKATYLDNLGGQVGFDQDTDRGTTNAWGMNLVTNRYEGWAKLGKVYIDQPWKSVGLQLSGVYHDQDSYFGLNVYDANQQNLYGNLIYQSMIGNTDHQFKTGASIQYDKYDEVLNANDYGRTEIVPGAYFEYSYSLLDKFNTMAGIRVDHHNLYGAFVTPRIHLRYALTDQTVLRASMGRGQRTASIIAENIGLLASSRALIVQGDGSDKPYGLDAEVAWNYGINLTQEFRLDYRDGSFSVEYYRTNFENQIVVDLDQNPQQVSFYNLNGQSYSNSFQTQVDYEILKFVDMRIGYRWFDVNTTYGDTNLQKPLVSAHRAFLNLGYETRSDWKFDYTFNWQGEKRIPYTGSNPLEYQLPQKSPDFYLMNVQVTKSWSERFEVYVGVENVLNYTQDNPILASEDPFGNYFDSSLVWGPIFGRNTYAGLRYRIK
ncbi:MAG: TonB-dependent receptor [Reichenbachiella sp.]|uniref:TonB-dependent receptor n=1 Tax=Reichenbachiella sp. TaxID=2184521 RepID=UPI0029660253|nr:TonB-dependent receptor [Reichenbachiella sp.]MDW3208848.1 TonB-dependent receptor [Reichenbachiella sp.]